MTEVRNKMLNERQYNPGQALAPSLERTLQILPHVIPQQAAGYSPLPSLLSLGKRAMRWPLSLASIVNEKLREVLITLLLIFGVLSGGLLFGQTDPEINLELSINARECYTGDSLTLQALVSGTDQVEIGELPDPEWGTISYRGGQRRNSQSITNINGKFTRVEEKGFLMSFQITPARAGEFTVPEIIFDAEGRLLSSNPFTIRAKTPEKSEDYALELDAGLSTIYPGQEFVLDVKWYYKKGARDLGFTVPFLDDFEYLGQMPVRGRSYELVLNKMMVQASGDEGFSPAFGEKATYLAFSLILKAKEPGVYELSEASSRFEGVTGTEAVRDFFGNKQIQEKYSTLLINGEGESLTVLPLPPPPAGSSVSGNRTILGPAVVEAELSKPEISVGEPITLTITFTGAGNSDFSIPPLSGQAGLEQNFSIPPERSPGRSDGNSRTFVQTIRAKNAQPKVFPALVFLTFNTNSGEWEEINTDPLPITILNTLVADSGDLEIFEDSGPAVRDLERNKSGLEASFSGPELLGRERAGLYPWMPPALFYIILLGPPALWLLLFLRKIRFFGRRRQGATEFRKFLKTWKKNSAMGKELSLKAYETALGGFMETETPTPGRGIYGYEEELESSPQGLEAYRIIREILDRGIYASSTGNGDTDNHINKKLIEAGEILLKEMLK